MKNFRTFAEKLYSDLGVLRFEERFQAIRSNLRGAKSHLLRSKISPVVFVIAVLWTIFSMAMAFASMMTLFGSLLVLYFILTRIFGVDLQNFDAVEI